LSLNKCNLYNNSPNTSATVLNGGAVIEGCTAIDACGSKAFLAQPDVPSGNIDIPIITGAAPAPDPYANLTPPTVASFACNAHPSFPQLSSASTPGGTYTAPANNDTVNLSPGTYNVVGGLDVHAGTTISGT